VTGGLGAPAGTARPGPAASPAPATPWIGAEAGPGSFVTPTPADVNARNQAVDRSIRYDQSRSLIGSGLLALLMAVAGLLLVGRRRRQW
jgi:hypothetical protein